MPILAVLIALALLLFEVALLAVVVPVVAVLLAFRVVSPVSRCVCEPDG